MPNPFDDKFLKKPSVEQGVKHQKPPSSKLGTAWDLINCGWDVITGHAKLETLRQKFHDVRIEVQPAVRSRQVDESISASVAEVNDEAPGFTIRRKEPS